MCASRTTPYVGRNLLGEFHDVTVHEKKPTEFVVIDQIQLFLHPPQRVSPVLGSRRVIFVELTTTKFRERTWRSLSVLTTEVRKGITEIFCEVEPCATLGDCERVGDSIGSIMENRFHLLW